MRIDGWQGSLKDWTNKAREEKYWNQLSKCLLHPSKELRSETASMLLGRFFTPLTYVVHRVLMYFTTQGNVFCTADHLPFPPLISKT